MAVGGSHGSSTWVSESLERSRLDDVGVIEMLVARK